MSSFAGVFIRGISGLRQRMRAFGFWKHSPPRNEETAFSRSTKMTRAKQDGSLATSRHLYLVPPTTSDLSAPRFSIIHVADTHKPAYYPSIYRKSNRTPIISHAYNVPRIPHSTHTTIVSNMESIYCTSKGFTMALGGLPTRGASGFTGEEGLKAVIAGFVRDLCRDFQIGTDQIVPTCEFQNQYVHLRGSGVKRIYALR